MNDASTAEPLTIADFCPSERLIVAVPSAFAQAEPQPELAPNGSDTLLRLGQDPILILKGVSDPASVDISVIADLQLNS